MNMKGRWKGQYTYEENYPAVKGKSVAFELDLSSSGVEFEGYFTDDETRHLFKTAGTLHGYLEGDTIVFSKWYPCWWGINEAGEIIIDYKQPSQEIYYTGNLNSDGTFNGEWEIPAAFIDDEGNYTEVAGRGTWLMQRA